MRENGQLENKEAPRDWLNKGGRRAKGRGSMLLLLFA
jgi:hypothetical protein